MCVAYNPVHNSFWAHCSATGLLHAWRNPGLAPLSSKESVVAGVLGGAVGSARDLPATEAAGTLLQALGQVAKPFVGRPVVRGLPFNLQGLCEGWTTLPPRSLNKPLCVPCAVR